MAQGWHHGVWHNGRAEPGLPAGGLDRQILRKDGNTGYTVTWEDMPKITVSDTAPLAPAVGDVWIDTS